MTEDQSHRLNFYTRNKKTSKMFLFQWYAMLNKYDKTTFLFTAQKQRY